MGVLYSYLRPHRRRELCGGFLAAVPQCSAARSADWCGGGSAEIKVIAPGGAPRLNADFGVRVHMTRASVHEIVDTLTISPEADAD